MPPMILQRGWRDRHIVSCRSGGRDGHVALGWNIVVWLGFIAGTEFFVAYQAEGPFRELLAIALLMAVVIAVVPDDAGQQARPPGAGGPGDHRQHS